MSAALLAAVLVLVASATAWAAFVSDGTYTVGNDPYFHPTGDFNGDGLPDVATVNGSSQNVSVYLRQAGGGFAQDAGSPYAVGNGPSAAVAADFNGDGLADLAVTNFVGQSVTVLLRQPGGGFAQGLGSPINVGARISAIVAGDFAGDGQLDLAVAENDNSRVTILVRGVGSFSPQLNLPTGTTPSGIAVADFNGDSASDLAVANRGDGTATILLRVPGGGFTSEGAVPAGSDAVGLTAADFNGDGRPDLAVADYAPGTVSVLLRRPTNNGFDAEPAISVASPATVTTADFDRDGRPDLAIPSNTGAVAIARRNAGGGFTFDPLIPLAGSVNGIAAADFNRDGRPDLAVSSYTNTDPADTFTALLNPAPAGPPPTPTPTPLPTPVAGKTVNVALDSGKVKIKRPGSKQFVTLTGAAQIPVGTTVDTREGRIEITAAQGKGKTATADFFDGIFKLSQTKGSKPVTTLTLTEKLTCPKSTRASAAAKKKKSRKLWGEGSGSFRTRGQYSAATVRGTKWLVQDRCTSTLTKVTKGVVTVNDLVKHKTVIVRAGKTYTARAKRK
jgi:hypothetical protein